MSIEGAALIFSLLFFVVVGWENMVHIMSRCYSRYHMNCSNESDSCFHFKVISYESNMLLVGVS